MTEEQHLVEGCINKDINAQRELYERYAKKMLSVCVRYMCDEDEARDTMHDGFVKLFDKIGMFDRKGSLEGWIRKMFVNLCLENLRKVKKMTFQSINSNNDELQLVDSSISDTDSQIGVGELMNLVKELPMSFRSVFNLHAIEGYSHDEVAVILGIKPSAVRSNYFKARILLQKKIESRYK
ncbi:MAG: sigma-70 family RNA polymerase sigma factor [Prevotellaceae bacterium]|jgi:RNA polymerase sigma-70 factor (ECF subfamily)|nr:sigma-70 family RNA polymerase sigma factor [Prevotellaceae bacterium]